MDLYKWQKEAIECWKENNYRGIVEVATGAGKSFMAASAALALKKQKNGNLNIKIVVPQIAIMKQWKETFKKLSVSSKEIAYFKQKEKDRAITIYVINSARMYMAWRVLQEMQEEKNVLLILDEYHHYASTENNHIFDFIQDPSYRPGQYMAIGLSATKDVYKLEQNIISNVGPLIYTYSLQDAVKDEVIAQFKTVNVGCRLNEEDNLVYDELCVKLAILERKLRKKFPSLMRDDSLPVGQKLKRLMEMAPNDLSVRAYVDYIYKRRNLLIKADSRLKAALELLKIISHENGTIVFSERIEQIELLCKLAKNNGIAQIEVYHSKQGAEVRKAILENFKMKETTILLCCKALDEGLDVPAAENAIIISSTDTERQRIQRTGRILRKSENKAFSSVYYIYMLDTIERSVLMYDMPQETKSVELKFYEDEFHNLVTDYARERILETATDEKIRSQLKPYLLRASVSTDLLLTEQEIENSNFLPKYRLVLKMFKKLGCYC